MHMNTFHTSTGLLYGYVRRITVCARANRSHRLRGFYYGRLANACYKECLAERTNTLKKKIDLNYTGRFIMFSVITNIYNNKTKGPILMELFTATRKLKKFFFDN